MRVDIMTTTAGDVVLVYESQVGLLPGAECRALIKLLNKWNGHQGVTSPQAPAKFYVSKTQAPRYRQGKRDTEVLDVMRMTEGTLVVSTIREAYAKLGSNVNEGAISSALHRLHRDGHIKRVGGAGRATDPFQYEVVEAADAAK